MQEEMSTFGSVYVKSLNVIVMSRRVFVEMFWSRLIYYLDSSTAEEM